MHTQTHFHISTHMQAGHFWLASSHGGCHGGTLCHIAVAASIWKAHEGRWVSACGCMYVLVCVYVLVCMHA